MAQGLVTDRPPFQLIEDGEGFVVQLDVEVAGRLGQLLLRAIPLLAAELGVRPNPAHLQLGEQLRRAPLAADLAACGNETASAPHHASSVVLMTTSEIAHRDGRSARTVRHRAATGRYPGAIRRGRDWLIPASKATA